jgi:hypothetical protein
MLIEKKRGWEEFLAPRHLLEDNLADRHLEKVGTNLLALCWDQSLDRGSQKAVLSVKRLLG